MRVRVEPRLQPSAAMRVLAPLIATVATIVVGSALFAALGTSPLSMFRAFFVQPISTPNGISEWLLKASPLILIALGLSIGFRANVWNIGAEGQFVIGAVAAAGVALYVPVGAPGLVLPLMLLAGAAGGMAWAAIAALLKARANTSEILVTLMLTYIAGFVLSYLVHGPWRDPDGFNYPQTALFPAEAMFSPVLPSFRLTHAIWITVAAVFATWLLADRSFLGYRLRVGGAAPHAARYAGFSAAEATWYSLLISGGAAGIAGMAEAAGPLGQLSASISPGYGFAAIIVAFVGRLHAFGIVLAGLLLSLLYLGGEAVQMSLGLPAAITRVFQGMLLFFLLASDFLVRYRVSLAEA